MIDRLSESIIATDRNGNVRYYNEHARKLYPGLEHDPSAVVDTVCRALEDGQNVTVGDRVYSPEENDLVYEGENYGKLYALVDETDHIRYMDELKKQKEIADSASEAKSRFLANMSHEIRTPINAVLGMDEMILRESKDSTIRSYAADIMSAGKTLLSLIGDILDLSKVEEGKMEIIPVQYDLASLINDLSNMIRDRATRKGLEFDIDVDEHIPHILWGDEIRIRQCVLNILTNAVKYTEKGSVKLTVSYRPKDDENIILGFSVADTGIGMRKEDIDILFSPYKRLDEKRNRTIEGTGLGMSITRQLLDLMGSSLSVESKYGKGSVISFEIEQKTISNEEIGSFSSRFNEIKENDYSYHELFHAPDARILVVDDTEMNLTVMQNLLKKTMIRIDSVLSGKEAVRCCSENRYDAVFIDHMMSDMDGMETLKRIRRDGLNRETPAIALTANAVSGARKMYLDAGFSDYLSKPVDGTRLERMLKKILPADKIEEAEITEETEDAQLPRWLLSVKELDVKTGLDNCGSTDGYLSVLSVFYRTGADKADEIEWFFNEGNIPDYTVKVHALKSSARIIGASGLSKLAEKLEEAGKIEDNAYIGENTEKLLLMYRDLNKKLEKLSETDDDLPKIEPEAVKEAYQTIKEIAGSMDYALMDEAIRSLKGYRLSPSDRENVEKIEGYLNMLDWDAIGSVAEEGYKSEV